MLIIICMLVPTHCTRLDWRTKSPDRYRLTANPAAASAAVDAEPPATGHRRPRGRGRDTARQGSDSESQRKEWPKHGAASVERHLPNDIVPGADSVLAAWFGQGRNS